MKYLVVSSPMAGVSSFPVQVFPDLDYSDQARACDSEGTFLSGAVDWCGFQKALFDNSNQA